jgi:glycosyltransferase involved in cell wall biosynthesis
MRILYCNKYNFAFSGTESYLFAVMRLMRQRGHEAALFAMSDPRGEPTPYDRHFVPLIDLKQPQQSTWRKVKLAAHVIYSRDARRRLRRMIAEFKPDVAHVRNIYHHLSPSVLWELKAQKVPVIYHVNDFKMLCPSYNLVAQGQACERCRGGKFWRVVSQRCYSGPRSASMVLAAEAYVHRWLKTYERCVDAFLAPSQFVKEKLVEAGQDAAKIHVLRHFQQLPGAAPPLKTDAAVLYFGRLSTEKGIGDLLHAMRDLPDVRLQIAGDGPQRAELETLSQSLALGNVEFLGHRGGTELEQLIGAARFTLFPSHAYETLGKSILESYAWGRPVIASDLGSRRELVKDGHTGLLYPVGDVQKLGQAIALLIRHPALAARMGAEGRRFVKHQHQPEDHYRQLVELYKGLGHPLSPREPATVPDAKPPLKIAFIGGRGVVSKYSGIESYYEEVGRHLAAIGHEVTVYCRSYFTPDLEQHNGMRLVRLPTIRSKHLETLVHTCLSTLHASLGPYDVVHFHALGPALFSFFPRLFGKKTVVTVQGLDWQRKKWGRIAAGVLRLGEQASVKLPNATMVVSQTLQQHYENSYGTIPAYVPNGTSLRKRRAPSQLVKWGIEPGRYMLFLGRFSPEKNCHLLIEAFEWIRTDVKLVLAGGSSYSDAYVAELRRHASDRIRLLNWVSGDDLDELLSNAMLFVLPSDLEGLSLALLDAMGAGVCVLTSDVPENCEVVHDAGFTFRRGDVRDLARMLEFLIANPQLRKAAAAAARQRVSERYLWRGIAEQISQTYLQLVHPGARKAPANRPPSQQRPRAA